MSLVKGRILRAADLAGAPLPIASPSPPAAELPRARVVPREAALALAEASGVVAAAEARAREIVAQAESAAADVTARAEGEGTRAAEARLAAAFLRLSAERARAEERDLERSIELARAMAERLLGEALALDPGRVTAIARQVLSTVRSVRRVTIDAHPDDATVLSGEVRSLGLEQASIEIHADASRARGSLVLRTDLGILDADLTLQLDRLVAALRDGPSGS